MSTETSSQLIQTMALVAGLFGVTVAMFVYFNLRRIQEESNERIKVVASIEQDPEKAKPAWDLARIALESYFNRNLSQVTAIFWLCAFVMFLGFLIVAWGIALAIREPEDNLPVIITALAGVITEVIGATFLLIYRSTMQQAINYTRTLERINSVGMAMHILDTIPDSASDNNLKHSTKADVVKMLMRQSFEIAEGDITSTAHSGGSQIKDH